MYSKSTVNKRSIENGLGVFWERRQRFQYKPQADKHKVLWRKNQKLDQEKLDKGYLSLDSQRHFHKQLLCLKQNQLVPTAKHVEAQEEEGEDKQEHSLHHLQETPPSAPLPSAGEFLRRFQLLYGISDPYSLQPQSSAALPPPPRKRRSCFSSDLSLEPAAEHARLRENMAESSHNNRPTPARPRSRNTGGEIVEVQGGHIVRSTGRKDRHSKVCTAKGPRDRRVRLAAHTAIQFYDVQDRLGYDRPSKAVDWLIKKAKSAIDELAQLPAWHPTAAITDPNPSFEQDQQKQNLCTSADLMTTMNNTGNNNNPTSFLPPSLDSDAIVDTIKSFFPVGAPAEPSSSAMDFQSFPTHDNNTNNQDLRLSLQSFQDLIMLHNHNPNRHNLASSQPQVLLSGHPLRFDGWPEHHQHQHQASELSRFQRLPAWNSSGESGGAAAGNLFNSPQAQVLSQNLFLSQRGPLQSSNTPTIRAWIEPPPMDRHHYPQQLHPSVLPIFHHQSSISGFSGFRIPVRIQGDEEEQRDGCYNTDKPPSVSSDSRH